MAIRASPPTTAPTIAPAGTDEPDFVDVEEPLEEVTSGRPIKHYDLGQLVAWVVSASL